MGGGTRVGGGTDEGSTVTLFADGLSPRGRGNHAEGDRLLAELGSIPAWAGEPVTIHSPYATA